MKITQRATACGISGPGLNDINKQRMETNLYNPRKFAIIALARFGTAEASSINRALSSVSILSFRTLFPSRLTRVGEQPQNMTRNNLRNRLEMIFTAEPSVFRLVLEQRVTFH